MCVCVSVQMHCRPDRFLAFYFGLLFHGVLSSLLLGVVIVSEKFHIFETIWDRLQKTASKMFVFRNAKQICLAHSWIFIKCKFLKKFQLINAIFDYQLFVFSSFLLSRTLEICAFSWDEMLMRFKSLALFFQWIGQTSHRNWAAERWIPCINLNFYRAKL